ncbi:MAG: dipeptidase [Chitinophagaceae bacterium]
MLRRIFLFSFTILPFMLSAQSYKKLHFKSMVVDTHNDILSKAVENGIVIDADLTGKTHSDLNRFLKGGIDVQVFSVWCDGERKEPFNWANREMDSLDAVIQRNPDKIVKTGTPEELRQAVKNHKLAAMFGVEGGHMIENNLDNLNKFFDRGTRYMTLTWNNSTDWATSAEDETQHAANLKHKGLTDFGRQVIQRMNKLGMMVDLSHVGEQTFYDAIAASTKPIIVSHSCVYNICPVSRNLKDAQIKAVQQNGGVIDLNFFSGFVDSNYNKHQDEFLQRHKAEMDSLLQIKPDKYYAYDILFSKHADEVEAMRPPLSLLIDHLDYIVNLIGVDYVGLGSDFDGINSSPKELNDVTDMPLITKELKKRGYSKKEIKKILGGNFMRVFEANMSGL